MTAAKIIERIQECGGDVLLMPDRRLCIEQRSRIPDTLAQAVRLQANEVRVLLASRTTLETPPDSQTPLASAAGTGNADVRASHRPAR